MRIFRDVSRVAQNTLPLLAILAVFALAAIGAVTAILFQVQAQGATDVSHVDYGSGFVDFTDGMTIANNQPRFKGVIDPPGYVRVALDDLQIGKNGTRSDGSWQKGWKGTAFEDGDYSITVQNEAGATLYVAELTIDANGDGNPTATATATPTSTSTPTPVPGEPGSLTASLDDNQVTLNWSAADDATDYEVDVGTKDRDWDTVTEQDVASVGNKTS